MTERSLVILKPDCVQRGLLGKVIQRYENLGFRLVASKMKNLSKELLQDHYSHLVSKPFFNDIVGYMTSSPVLIQIWEGDNVVDVIRKNNGATDPTEASPGTVRGDFATTIRENVVHASEDADAAEEEINRFFTTEEIATY